MSQRASSDIKHPLQQIRVYAGLLQQEVGGGPCLDGNAVLSAVADAVRYALQQAAHVRVVAVVRGDGPHQAQRPEHGCQHARDLRQRRVCNGAEVALQRAQDLVVVPRILVELRRSAQYLSYGCTAIRISANTHVLRN